MLTVLLVIAILVLLIVVHEFGHFLAAKLFGVRVEEFGVGYPPRAFTFGKAGGTEYTLNWIPFGGFVRLFGDEGEKEQGRGSFVDASRTVQFIILIAGVLANIVLAWALFVFAFHIGIPQQVERAAPNQPVQLLVSDVVPGSPAASAGLQPGDQILGVSDERGAESKELSPEAVTDFVKVRGGRPISVLYQRGSATSTATMRPANAVIPSAAGRPAIGIALVLVAEQSLPWGDAVQKAFIETGNAFVVVLSHLGSLVASAVRGAPDLGSVVGPVGIVSYVGAAAQSGFGAVLILAALISVNLTIINLFPIPALDGGRIVVLIVEALMRRSAPLLTLQILNALGIALIITLMLVVTYNDVARLIQ